MHIYGKIFAAALFTTAPLFAQDRQLVDDGNLLFYNAPVAVDVGQDTLYAYLTTGGAVYVADLAGVSDPVLVHDYIFDLKFWATADDHAAPALFWDQSEARLLVATSYHSSPLFIYERRGATDGFDLLRELPGAFTYPRFVTLQDETFLFARLFPKGSTHGDLVMLRGSEDFAIVHPVVTGEEGTVIYAGSIVESGSEVHFGYSTLDRAAGRAFGLTLVSFDPLAGKITSTCELASKVGMAADADSRPTGIGISDGVLRLGTAFSSLPFNRIEGKIYRTQSTAAVVQGRVKDCDSFQLLHSAAVTDLYYRPAIAIAPDLTYLYFGKDSYVSDRRFDGCFDEPGNMYPNFVPGGVIYATLNNGAYELANFDNSVRFCAVDDQAKGG